MRAVARALCGTFSRRFPRRLHGDFHGLHICFRQGMLLILEMSVRPFWRRVTGFTPSGLAYTFLIFGGKLLDNSVGLFSTEVTAFKRRTGPISESRGALSFFVVICKKGPGKSV